MEQILLPSEVYTQLSLWCKLHQGFGLSYVFSDDQIGMHWLRERLAEDFRHAPQETGPHAAKQRTLLFIAAPDPMAFFRPLAEYKADTTPVLFWLQPPADAVLVWLKRLNEQRQRLIARDHMLILCLPTDSLTLEQATAIAVDLWSVRSFAYTARGRYFQEGFRADTDFAQTQLRPSPAKAESTWTPAMSAWQAWYEKNADLPADSDKRLAGPLSLSLQASEDAQGLQQWDVAVRFAEDALALWQRLGEAEQTRFTAARLAIHLGFLKYRLGQGDSARSHYTQALDLFTKEQYDPGRADTIRSLGDLERHLGQVDSARSLYTQALDLYIKEHDDLGRANTLRSLGDLDRRLGEVDSARSRYKQAVDLFAKVQDDLGRANTHLSLGDLDRHLGQVVSARSHYTQALDLYAKVQDDLGRANTLLSIGDLDRHLGQVVSARSHYTQALDLYAKVQDDLGRANTLLSIGDLDRHLGQVVSARSHYTQALDLFAREQHDLGRANTLQSLGDLDRHIGQVDSARTLYTQALDLYAKEQEPMGLAYTSLELALLENPPNPQLANQARAYAKQTQSQTVIAQVEQRLAGHAASENAPTHHPSIDAST